MDDDRISGQEEWRQTEEVPLAGAPEGPADVPAGTTPTPAYGTYVGEVGAGPRGGLGAPPGGAWAPPGGWTAYRPPEPWLPPPPEQPRRPRRRGLAVVAIALAALIVLVSGVGIGWHLGDRRTANRVAEPPIATAPPPSSRGGSSGSQNPLGPGSAGSSLGSTQAIANAVEPGVVDINTVIGAVGAGSSGNGRALGAAAGTGMVLTPTGEVLTNNHVIAGAGRIRVTVPGHGSFSATVIGVDPTDDVALIQMQGASNLKTVTLGNSSSVSIGDTVVAIGNAGGRGGTPTVTSGRVTAVGRAITVGDDHGGTEHLDDVISTDADIRPGDSGGALANTSGQVVGIITAGSRSGGFGGVGGEQPSGQGFAIAMAKALPIVNQMRAGRESGNVLLGDRGFLGVEVEELTPQRRAQLGFSVAGGALVVDVIPGTPAAQAGMKGPAVVTAVDGRTISSTSDLGPAIYAHTPGQTIRVTWVDANGSHSASVTLISGPAV